MNRSRNADDSEAGENLKEVWIHEDCAVWCQNVTLIGEEVRGLEEAVTEANENVSSFLITHFNYRNQMFYQVYKNRTLHKIVIKM